MFTITNTRKSINFVLDFQIQLFNIETKNTSKYSSVLFEKTKQRHHELRPLQIERSIQTKIIMDQ